MAHVPTLPVNKKQLAGNLSMLGWRKNRFPGAWDKATEALSQGCTYNQAAHIAMEWATTKYGRRGIQS